jgi:hypothetical protein
LSAAARDRLPPEIEAAVRVDDIRVLAASGSKSNLVISPVVVLGLALAAVIGLKFAHMSPELQWVGSIGAEAKTRHVHPGMDDDTLLSLTPAEGTFATRMRTWFPLYDRLEARGLVEVERRAGMYVVRRLVPNCASLNGDTAHTHRCG